jgi:hypothetical protein
MPTLQLGRLIAEFVVIVVGVLVALGVDEWRTAAQQRTAEARYIQRLIEDLDSDSALMAEAVTVGQDKVTSLDAVAESLRDPTRVRRTPSSVLPNLLYSYARPPLQTTTFEELLSTGTLSLIRSDSIRFQIADHYRRVVHDSERLDERRTRLAWTVNDLFPVRAGEPSAVDQAFLSAPNVADRLARLLGAEYQGLIYEERDYGRNIQSISAGILRRTVALLTTLRAYQDGLQ